MSPEIKALFFVVAVVLFAIEAVLRRSLVAGGLAAFAFPFAWDAFELAVD